jgi:membrane protein implicated in regulation of membrane protease activity
MWTLWWVWMVGALALAFLEVLISGWIFLGFAVGAAVTGLLFAVGGPIGGLLSGSLPFTLVVFAVLSLIAWIVLRRAVGVREGQVKVWDKDINEN